VVSRGCSFDCAGGAQFLFYPPPIGWLPDEDKEMNLAQHSAWETIQRSHAIANGVYVIGVNRVGVEANSPFGDSLSFLIRLAGLSPGLRPIRKKFSS